MISAAFWTLPEINKTSEAADFYLIHDIQGSGTSSPFVGGEVEIEGVVVGVFQEPGLIGGFFVQEEDGDADGDPLTSEGIYVHDTANAVAVGDLVRVTATVSEYYGMTELSSVARVDVTSNGNRLPTAADVSLPLAAPDRLERHEGMLVTFPQTLTVNDTYNLGRYGTITLSHERLYHFTHANAPDAAGYAAHNDALALKKIILDDAGTAQNPDPIAYPGFMLDASNTLRNGYSVSNLTGVINYGFGEYRVYATENVNFETQANPRPTAPDSVGGTLKVAGFNVLNYFSTLDTGDPVCGPASDLDCRGADSASEFARQRDKIINAILDVDADIVGLVEMENHATDAALDDLVSGLNAVAGTGTYAKVDTGTIGSDAVKVALIYKPGTVAAVGAHAILDDSVDPAFNDEKNRPVLARTFRETATGEVLTIAVNHLKSKGSDCDALGDQDLDDGQGNCNLARTHAATALANWLDTDPTGSGDADFLIIGDLNSYSMEDPITALKNAGYIDLTNRFGGSAAYSYVHYGEAGCLDHALASAGLAGQVTGAVVWHVNADEPKVLDYNEEYKSAGQLSGLYNADCHRASDHDPVVIGLALDSGNANLCNVDIADAVTVLKILTGTSAGGEYIDFDGDGKAGMADTVGILQCVGEIR